MLELKDIKKDYGADENIVRALKGVTLSFRKSEFVSILGPSGCGKTTMLNIVGGLDRYTEGDLLINGRSTRLFKDYDWDAYRNKYVGFVFQTYNLISHQTVLGNVELALTLSGITKSERRKRAMDALEKVGLSDKLKKRPNQLSGGQMQRVAIARAIVNDPSIILADEPTGALDSVTSVQIMEILKEISKDRLVIMVTHNDALANKYSNRIIRLHDGILTGDDNPFNPDETERLRLLEEAGVDLDALKMNDPEALKVPKGLAGEEKKKVTAQVNQLKTQERERAKKRRASLKKTSMSFKTAISLSGRNLLTKKGRTFLVSLAASIGIIGIALVLAISNGFQVYIARMQAEMLSFVPVGINQQYMDIGSLIGPPSQNDEERPEEFPDSNQVTVNPPQNRMADLMHLNRLTQEYIDHVESFDTNKTKTVDIQRVYGIEPNLVRHTGALDNPVRAITTNNYEAGQSAIAGILGGFGGERGANFQEMLDNDAFVKQQYDVLQGYFPGDAPNLSPDIEQVALIIDRFNRITTERLNWLGLPATPGETSFSTYIGQQYIVLNNDNFYNEDNGIYRPKTGNDLVDAYNAYNADKDIKLQIVGIMRISPDTPTSLYSTGLVHRKSLTQKIIALNADSELAKAQAAENAKGFNGKYLVDIGQTILDDISAGIADQTNRKPMAGETFAEILTKQMIENRISFPLYSSEMAGLISTFPQAVQDQINAFELKTALEIAGDMNLMDEIEQFLPFLSIFPQPAVELLTGYVAMLETALFQAQINALNICAATETPVALSIFPLDFEQKAALIAHLDKWNDTQTNDAFKVHYSDTLSMLGDTMGNLVNIIGYVLVAFAAVSLVVSSIMIAIITYVSVIERTKEIGVLRSIGARKKDISRVFNAETIIIGLFAGLLGVGIAYLFTIPINFIIGFFVARNGGMNIGNLAILNPLHALILVAVSTVLTFISGFIPSRMAAKKDPVVALRTE
ncbi:MAG: ATP-binding cassette domain-containing protein [Firmicutes bacterium]|nr:ATP-binding cassette domain-containing protein [Bacillota bacterium]